MRRLPLSLRGGWAFALAVVVAVALLGAGARPTPSAADTAPAPTGGPAPGQVMTRAPDAATPEKHDTSPPLRSMTPKHDTEPPHERAEVETPTAPPSGRVPDTAIQSSAPLTATPSPTSAWDGIGQGFTGPAGSFSVNVAPPDPNGDVGLNNYVQVVNDAFAVFDKNGVAQYGPAATRTLFSGFGGGCESNNDGDATVKYDRAADRWVISQFSVSSQPFLQCVAVSTSGDPTGTYNRYSFQYANFPDYPKLGVWPDGYYETFDLFNPAGTTFLGPQVCAYDRTAMLAGRNATQQCFVLPTAYGPLLPSDLDGATPPPAGSPNFVMGLGTNSLNLWRFHIDWNNPSSSTLTGPTNIPVAAFQDPCGAGGPCAPQPFTGTLLDSLGDRLMYRLAYRNFGGYESIVVTHSVVAGSSMGVRWYEIRSPNTTPTVFQQSTYAPDGTARWMGSAAMDRLGDIAVGYSASSSGISPSIRYAGRLAGDALNTLGQGETTLISGVGSQTVFNGRALNRWGDYSSMSIDPSDDCTFWYTNEYLPFTGAFNWSTRIGAFKFPGCGPASASVTPGALTYGSTTVGTASAGQNVTITNTGSGTLVVNNLSTSGANPTDFVATATLPITVAPGSNTTVPVKFTPTAVGGRAATLDITSNAATVAHVDLAGTGACSPGPCVTSPNPVWQSHPPAATIDGDLSSWWQPTAGPGPFGTDPKTLQFTLGSATTLTSLRLRYYSTNYRFIDYTIATSNDASVWTTVATVTGNTLADRTDTLTSTTARYLRVVATKWMSDNGAQWGPAVVEANLGVPSSPGSGICSPAPCATSPNPSYQTHTPGSAIDGDLNTYWQPTAGPGPFGTDPKTLQITLPAATTLTSLRLRYYSANYRFIDYTVATSNDATTWTTVATVTANASADRTDALTSTNAQYLRVVATNWSSDNGSGYGPAVLEATWGSSAPPGPGTCSPAPCATSPNPSYQTHTPGSAIDGDLNSYWQPTAGPGTYGTDPKTLQITLTAPTTLTSLRLRYYSTNYRFIDYTIATSTDGSFWTTVATVTGNTVGDRTDVLNSTTAQYLRVVATNWAGDSGTAYGPAVLEANWNVATPATASSPNPAWQNRTPDAAIDGNLSTWWQPTAGPGPFGTDPKTIQFTLPAQATLTSLRLRYYSTTYRFIDYTIATSNDATTWATVATVTGNTLADRTDTLTSTTARYLRVIATRWSSDSGAAYGPAVLEANWS